MTWFSLKRTLQHNLASKFDVDVPNLINPGSNTLNLHIPVRHSELLLSIGKITKICHQNIPLKKLICGETVMYFSVIPLKLASALQLPAADVASVLLSVLAAHTPQGIWSDVKKTDKACLEFVIAQQGIQRWQEYLHHNGLSQLIQRAPPMASQTLWQLQSGYELCCRWCASHAVCDREVDSWHHQCAQRPFAMPIPALTPLVDALLDICDLWDEATPAQLLQRARQLVLALDYCLRNIRPASTDATVVSSWVQTTQIVLKQLLGRSWGLQLAEHL